MNDNQQILTALIEKNVFMVTAIDGLAVTLRTLDSIIAEGKNGPALIIEDLLAQDLVGEDGIAVDISLGAVVGLRRESDEKLRLANAGAQDLAAFTKVAQAKMILGL